jgi:hypothetical protein
MTADEQFDEIPFLTSEDAMPVVPTPRKCLHPRGDRADGVCGRCGVAIDPARSRAGRNSRKRGGAAELTAARVVGGRKMGPLNLPWDVEIEGYLRLQVKKLATWPSLALIAQWLDAIPQSPAMRGVAVIQAAGPGTRGRRLLVLDLDEFGNWHGKVTIE